MQDISHYIERIKSGEVQISFDKKGRDKIPVLFEDCILLCTSSDNAKYHESIKPYVNDIADKNGNTPRILQTVIVNVSENEQLSNQFGQECGFVLEEIAPGKPLFSNGSFDQYSENITKSPEEILANYYRILGNYAVDLEAIADLSETHFRNYVNTATKLISEAECPLGYEKAGNSIFFDKSAGLTFIDLGDKTAKENTLGNEHPLNKIFDVIMFGGKNGNYELPTDLMIFRSGVPLAQLKNFRTIIEGSLPPEFVISIANSYQKILDKTTPALLENGVSQDVINEYTNGLNNKIQTWSEQVTPKEQLLQRIVQERKNLANKSIEISDLSEKDNRLPVPSFVRTGNRNKPFAAGPQIDKSPGG